MTRRKVSKSNQQAVTPFTPPNSTAPPSGYIIPFDPEHTKISIPLDEYIHKIIEEGIENALQSYKSKESGFFPYIKKNWLLIAPIAIGIMPDEVRKNIWLWICNIFKAISNG